MFISIKSMQFSHIAVSEKEESMESDLLLIGEHTSGRSESSLKAKVSLQGLSSRLGCQGRGTAQLCCLLQPRSHFLSCKLP